MKSAPGLLLHQYAMSPFSEKIRKLFAYKKLRYGSVEQPMWMPKPQLTPLTGGYRRIPVLQIGADVYCDTALIARKLDELAPKPTLYPGGNVAAVEAFAAAADRQLFLICVPIVFAALADVLPPELIEDRKRMRPDLSVPQLRVAAPALRGALALWCKWLERALATRRHLLGPEFSLADAAVFHCLWFVRNDPETAAALGRYAHVSDWMTRLEAMGAGDVHEVSAADALDIAAGAEPDFQPGVSEDDPSGLVEGATIGVFADDLPSDVFEGTVAAANDEEIVIVRETTDLGRIALHFPRVGYLFRPL